MIDDYLGGVNGMKYDRFEDLPVWQKSSELAAEMLEWCIRPELRGIGDLANQLQRACLSISNNIAEGFERGSTNELINFLYYSRGSAGEVRSMLEVMQCMHRFDSLRGDIANFKSAIESISRQIRGWTNSLQNSDISGQRQLNDQSRAADEQRQRRDAFVQKQRLFMEQRQRELKQAAIRRAEQQPSPQQPMQADQPTQAQEPTQADQDL